MPDLVIDVSALPDASPWDTDLLYQSNYGTTSVQSGLIAQQSGQENFCTPAGHKFGASRFLEITASSNAAGWMQSNRKMHWYLDYTDDKNHIRATSTYNGTNQCRFYIKRVVDGVEPSDTAFSDPNMLAYSGNIADADMSGEVAIRFEATEEGGTTHFAIYRNGVQVGSPRSPAELGMAALPAVVFRNPASGYLRPSKIVFGGYTSDGHPFIKRLNKELQQYAQDVGILAANLGEPATSVAVGGKACVIKSQGTGLVTIEAAPGDLIPAPKTGNLVKEQVTVEVTTESDTFGTPIFYTKTHLVQLPAPGDGYHPNSIFGADFSFSGAWANLPAFVYDAVTGEDLPLLFKGGATGWHDATEEQLKGDINEYLWLPHGFSGDYEITYEALLPNGETVEVTHTIEVA